MAISRCPHCNVPLLDEEANAPACPMCGAAFALAPPPAPPPPPPTTPRPWGLISVVAVLSAIVMVQALTRPAPAEPPPATPEPDRTAEKALADALDKEKRAAARLQSREKELAGKLAAEAGKRKQAEGKLADALARVTALEKALTEEKDKLPAFRLDTPTGSHRVERLDKGEVLRLAGRIGTLTIGAVRGGAILDASRLEARKIVLERSINGKSKVLLNAPKGTVTLTQIDGESTAVIDAPGGKVEVNHVTGESRLTVRAREARFPGAINGTRTEVAVTLTAGGALSFGQLLGSSKLSCKKEFPADPPLRLTEGRVDRAAKFEKLK